MLLSEASRSVEPTSWIAFVAGCETLSGGRQSFVAWHVLYNTDVHKFNSMANAW